MSPTVEPAILIFVALTTSAKPPPPLPLYLFERGIIAQPVPRPTHLAQLVITARTQWERTTAALRANTLPQVRHLAKASIVHIIAIYFLELATLELDEFHVTFTLLLVAAKSACSSCPSGRYEPSVSQSSCRFACPAVSGELFAKPRHSKQEGDAPVQPFFRLHFLHC